MSVPELPGNLRSLVDIGISLLRRTASGKVMLARYAQVVEDEGVPELIRARVREELDTAWAAIVEPFSTKAPKPLKIDKDPIAVTPTAQVHKGELDGEPVAVKFARPGVAATIRGELALLDTMTVPLKMVFPSLDVRGVMAEIRESVMDELDLEHEGDTQQRVRRALRRVDGLVVPDVHVDENAPDRLVTEFIDGPSLQDGKPKDPEHVAKLLVEAHLTAWREAGLILTDARPAHVRFLKDGSVGLLGTGLARPGSRDRGDRFVAAFLALAGDDADAFAAAVDELEIIDDPAAALPVLREVIGPVLTGEAVLDARAIHDVIVRAYESLPVLLALAAQATPDPADLAAARMLGQLTITLARLELKANWPELVRSALG